MQELQVNTEIIEVDKLKPHPRNPRTATKEAMDRLKKQIFNLGQYKPIIVDTRTGYIVGGHMRLEALKQLNMKRALVSYITSDNDAHAMEYMLSDNDHIGVTDKDALVEMLSELPEVRLPDFAIQTLEPDNLGDFMDQSDTVDPTSLTDSDTETIIKPDCVCPTCGAKHKKLAE